MTYFTDLFSPSTYESFSNSNRRISGFRLRQRGMAATVNVGDKFVCYVTRVSRWAGMLRVVRGPFENNDPIFVPDNDPFVVRFEVMPEIWLPIEKAIPIHETTIWRALSFTRGHESGSSGWQGILRGSLRHLSEEDGQLLERALKEQHIRGRAFPLGRDEWERSLGQKVRRLERDITVVVPEKTESATLEVDDSVPEARESHRMQALLAAIGSSMGLQIWIPKSDRNAVLSEWRGDHPPLLDRLPLNYDETTLKTIEQIDVLWLRGRSIRRAFEVEHTTSVYSGILRMADLLALQPNMDIRLHIVAPESRREKVFQELRRPVFSLLERGPLSESCSFLTYDGVKKLSTLPHLGHLSDSVVDEYEEEADV